MFEDGIVKARRPGFLQPDQAKYLIAHREALSERAAKDIIQDLASNLLVQRGMQDFAMPYEQVIALEDLQQCGWKNAIADVEYRSCEGFCTKFAFCLQEAEPDSKTAACFRLLVNATRLWLEAENPNAPFNPMEALERFSDADLTLLELFLPTAEDEPELSARIADILWIARKRFQAAIQATVAYVKAARTQCQTRPDYLPEWGKRIKRSIQIALQLNRKDLARFGLDYLDELLRESEDRDEGLLALHIIEMLELFNDGDPQRFIAICDKRSDRAEKTGKWLEVEKYQEYAAELHRSLDDESSCQKALIAAAEAMVEQGENFVRTERPSYLGATHHLARGIEALRQAQGPQLRIEELFARLRDYQGKSRSEFQMFEGPKIDISGIQQEYVAAIKGKSLFEAILFLGLGGGFPDPASVRKRVLEMAHKYPLTGLISQGLVDERGRTVATAPGILEVADEEREKVIIAATIRQGVSEYDIGCQIFVGPLLRRIQQEYPLNRRSLEFLWHHNQFVPPDREEMFARGFLAGFQADWIAAGHYLVPQLENSIRVLLDQSGIRTATMDTNLVEGDSVLSSLLSRNDVKAKLGEETVFNLQALLVDKHGANLRNLHAHGLLGVQGYLTPSMVLVWLMTLRFCCWPFAKEASNVSSKPQEE